MPSLKKIWSILKKTYREWSAEDPFSQSAIICYYAILSLPGLLIIIVWSLGRIFGEDAIAGRIQGEVDKTLGNQSGEYVQTLITNAYLDTNAMWYIKVVGIVTLVFGATTLFFQLQKTLNRIWHVEADADKGFKRLLVNRANSLGLIMVIAFLMLISLMLSSVLSAFNDVLVRVIGGEWKMVIQVINIVVSFGVIAVLFAFMFKVLPDVKFPWRAVWVGAFFTVLLFNLGKYALGVYFSVSNPSSGFGAAGTVILIMLWVNYTTLILLFGATFTHVYAREMKYTILPAKYAKWDNSYIMQHKDHLYPRLSEKANSLVADITNTIAKNRFIEPEDAEASAKEFLPKIKNG